MNEHTNVACKCSLIIALHNITIQSDPLQDVNATQGEKQVLLARDKTRRQVNQPATL